MPPHDQGGGVGRVAVSPECGAGDAWIWRYDGEARLSPTTTQQPNQIEEFSLRAAVFPRRLVQPGTLPDPALIVARLAARFVVVRVVRAR